jgi:hypothetical protein
MGGAHAGLDGPEGMLGGLAALTHGLRVLVEPLLDRFENTATEVTARARSLCRFGVLE